MQFTFDGDFSDTVEFCQIILKRMDYFKADYFHFYLFRSDYFIFSDILNNTCINY